MPRASAAPGAWPGPLAALAHAYVTMLATRPHATRSATAVLMFFASDAAAQALAARAGGHPRKRGGKGDQDWARSVRFAAFGGLLHAPACAAFFAALDAALPGTSPATVALKIGVDRAFFAPFILAAAIAWMQLTGGATPPAAARAVRARLARTWLLSCGVWIPAHVVGFSHVPLHLRVLYVNAVALAWNCALSALTAPRLLLPVTSDDGMGRVKGAGHRGK
jgi:hypothetical protein